MHGSCICHISKQPSWPASPIVTDMLGWGLQAIMALPRWKDGTLKGRIMVDVANEPSLLQIKWDVPHVFSNTGVTYPPWSQLYFSVTKVCHNAPLPPACDCKASVAGHAVCAAHGNAWQQAAESSMSHSG